MQNIISPLLGGVLIGLAAIWLAGSLGRVMGVSGIIKGILPPAESGSAWRYWFLVGTVAGVSAYAWLVPGFSVANSSTSYAVAAIAGVLVGIGTSMANGCTSGHAVCGIGRLSMRSVVATVTFLSAGIATVSLMRHFF